MISNGKGVINSNIHNFCSPQKFPKSNIKRINPDKSTFLKSNLLVSNILNHLSPDTKPNPGGDIDAYNNCKEEMKKLFLDDIAQKDKINRVHTLAKCRSQAILTEKEKKEAEIKKQVEQIAIMKIEMGDKARDILGGKEDTAYLGRNLFLGGEKFLKQMKEYHPSDKVNKIEATRMLMKQKAKSKGRQNLYQNRMNPDDLSETSQNISLNHITTSNSSSILENSDLCQKKSHSVAKEKERDHQIATMIRNGSYQSVLSMQKRHAAWEAFTDHWAQGFKKNDDIIITKKKRKTKKSPKHKFVDPDDQTPLDYHDKLTRHSALKKYRQNFEKTAASFQILSH